MANFLDLHLMPLFRFFIIALAPFALGCGTTKWSDSARTATEQLLISTAVDKAIDNMDFSPLSNKFVYLDNQFLDCIDKNYVVSTLRQHMLAEGCVLMPDAASADFVVEIRSGAVGTDHHDVLIGVPAISVPTGGLTGSATGIPEIPFAKTTAQKGIAKLACFAYNRETGQAIWQSGVFPVVSTAKDSWFLGTGPFQRGTIYDGTHFAGSHFLFMRKQKAAPLRTPEVAVTAQATFPERPTLVRKRPPPAANNDATKTAGGNGASAPQSVRGSSGPSLSASVPAAQTGSSAGANNTSAAAGISTGLPAGQVVRLPALPDPQSNGSTSGGLGFNSSWLKLK